MELLHANQQPERTDETRRRVAEEIYTEISLTVQRLLEVEQLDASHSRVIELRDEQDIARRALLQFPDTELPAQAA